MTQLLWHIFNSKNDAYSFITNQTVKCTDASILTLSSRLLGIVDPNMELPCAILFN